MKKYSYRTIAFLPFLWLVTGAVIADPIALEVSTDISKLTSLSATLATQSGDVAVNLQFEYANGAGFHCAVGSAMAGKPVSCAGTQRGSNYTISAKVPGLNAKLTITGVALGDMALFKLSLPKTKTQQITTKVVATGQAAPVISYVLLDADISDAGKISGTGHIDSAYSGLHRDVAFTGHVNTKKNVWNWSLKYPGDRLSFSGGSYGDGLMGQLTGRIGPAKVSNARQDIPMGGAVVTYRLTVQTAGSGSGQVVGPQGFLGLTSINCPNDCTAIYLYGQQVALTASPASGSTFAGWSGDPGCGTANFIMNSHHTCIATFNKQFIKR